MKPRNSTLARRSDGHLQSHPYDVRISTTSSDATRLDEKDAAGQGRAVAFDLAAYADIDHGYAATVHKNQGATVDQAHVLATAGMDRHLTYVALSRHCQAVQLHWSDDEFATPERLRRLLGRERAKDTTLDYAEPTVDPAAAYAERRGLDPLEPKSEIVVRCETGAPKPATEHDRNGADLNMLDGTEPALSALRQMIAQQKTLAGALATILPPSAQPSEQKPEQAASEGYREETISIVDGIVPATPRRPRDHVVVVPTPAPPLPADPAEAERQALKEHGREAVRRWNQMEHAELAAQKAQDWRAWGKAWEGLIAYAREIKHDAPLDRLLRERGRELGIAQGSRFELVIQSSEAEIVWALKQDLSPTARPSHSPSFGP